MSHVSTFAPSSASPPASPLGAACLPALAQADYPNKPVKVLTGFPAGQATDVLGRAVAQKLNEALGQQFFVDNKPGAAGIIATQAAMAAPADGYTLLLTSSGPLAVNPGLYSKLPYDPVKDFVPVAGLALVPLVLVTNPGFAPTSVKELVALAKAKPGTINYASGGNGVTNHLVMEMFRSTAGVNMTHVPYKGGPPALTDLMGGQVNVMFETIVAALPFVKQGRLRAARGQQHQALERRARRADPERARLHRLQRRAMGRDRRAGQHAGADRREAECRDQQGAGDQGGARVLRRAGRRADADESRRARRRSSRPRSPSGRGR